MARFPLFATAILFGRLCVAQTPTAPIDQLIPWLLDEQSQLRGIPFSEVILDATGKRVLPFDPKNETDQRVLKQIGMALDETLRRMNASDSVVQNVKRINEVSSHFEDSLRELLNASPGLKCDFPRTNDGKLQRFGYPDLRIVDVASNKAFYLDPKLYAAGSRDSSFRTFYFEPKVSTNKIHDHAVHFIAGIEHQPLMTSVSTASAHTGATHWKFTRWELIDLANFKVRLKAEFQGSNRDMYRTEAVVATGPK
ncbi:MAG TPA: hypothetical protein VKS98_00660 [Chthoniobacterales bacterium]|nr:hypothetical protein [Chthoniobacterales bacterium]